MTLSRTLLSALALSWALVMPSVAERADGVRRLPAMPSAWDADSAGSRWIVKWRGVADGAARAMAQATEGREAAALAAANMRLQALAQRLGHGVELVRHVSSAHTVVRAPASLVARVRALGADLVETVEPDRRRFPHLLSNDPGLSDQAWGSAQPSGLWHLKAPTAAVPAAINAVGAWAIERGRTNVVVAVLDTGARFDHPDLGRASAGGRLLPGYDFVSEDSPGQFATANDGDGRDGDASDPGDWLDAALAGSPSSGLAGCPVQDSSWHGTRVAGIIGAMANNGTGVVGIDWNARILPVRVLGRCGGLTSDIVAGMRWAGGLDVPGIPANSTPARVINLSLGGGGGCSITEQDAIDELRARGVVVVVSAGNEGGSVGSPANCSGVVAVGGLRHTGAKVGYSSFGSEVTISAPAGNCVLDGVNDPCLYSIDTTTNLGSTVPLTSGYTTQFDANVGTSFSAPMVAAVASLMIGANPALSPDEVVAALRATARPFVRESGLPTCPQTISSGTRSGQCNCTTTQCGAGMLDALAAVKAVAPVECFFAWAERSFPSILTPAAATDGTLDYVYRFYAGSGAYLGFSVSDPRLYFLAGGALTDLGSKTFALSQAACPAGP